MTEKTPIEDPDLDRLAADLMAALAAEPVPPEILTLAAQLQDALAARIRPPVVAED